VNYIHADFAEGVLEPRDTESTYAGLVLTQCYAGPDGQDLGSVTMRQKGLYVKHRKHETHERKHKIRVCAHEGKKLVEESREKKRNPTLEMKGIEKAGRDQRDIGVQLGV
jgi:hypothetical protein